MEKWRDLRSLVDEFGRPIKLVVAAFVLTAIFGLNGCAYIFFHLSLIRQSGGGGFSGLANVKALTDTSELLSWPSYPGAESYTVYNVTSGTPVAIATVTAPATTYTVTGLNPYTTYKFRVNVTMTSGSTDSNTNDVSGTTLPIATSIGAYEVASNGFVSGHLFTYGSTDGSFYGPTGIVFDSTNNVFYVVDAGNDRIVKLSGTGMFIGAVGNLSSSTGTCPNSGAASTWCTGGSFTSGSGDGMFYNPGSISLDSTNGILYVADTGNNRVVKLNASTGAFIGAIGDLSASTGTCPSSGATSTWCTGGTFTSGSGDGMFSAPTSARVDVSNDFLYVVDANHSRIMKFKASTGAFIGAIGDLSASTGTCPSSGAASTWCTGGTFVSGTADGMFNIPEDLALDPANDLLYVTDNSNSRIVKVTASTGAFIGAIGDLSASTGTCPSSGAASTWCTGGTFTAGKGDGDFNDPDGITVDPTNDALYVFDSQNTRVIKMKASTGGFVGAVGNTNGSTGSCPSSGAASGWCTGGTFASGAADGMVALSHPNLHGLFVDSADDALFFADNGNSRLVKLTASTGAFLGANGAEAKVEPRWSNPFKSAAAAIDGAFQASGGIALDETNHVLYIANSDRIEKFNSTTGSVIGAIGNLTASIGTCPSSGPASEWCTGGMFQTVTISEDGVFESAEGLALDTTNDFLYVSDPGLDRIDKFKASTGAFIGSIGNVTSSTGTCPSSGAVNAWCTGGNFNWGSGDGEFFNPEGLALDPANDTLYIADLSNNRVVKVKASTGAFIGAIGNLSSSTGTCPSSGPASGWCTGGSFAAGASDSDGVFLSPLSLAIDSANDKLFVGDYQRIAEIKASTGAFMGAIGDVTSSTGTCPASGPAGGWCTGGIFTNSNIDGAFYQAPALSLDISTGDLYVADNYSRVMKINEITGAFIGAMGNVTSSTGTCPSSGAAPTWCTGGIFSSGTGDGMFLCQGLWFGLAVSQTSSALYILDGGNYRVLQIPK